MIEIICPVRECGLPLARGERQWACATGHHFDVARSGHCNLLQPNERRSKNPGDSSEAARARRRLFERGIGSRFIDDVLRLAEELSATGPILDAGCGEGSHLAKLCKQTGFEGVGVDISTPSIELAAKRHHGLTWIVSNVDRHLPLGDRSVGTVLSITSRVNRAEFARVLRIDGVLIVVMPGADDLAELRQRVLGDGDSLERLPDIHPGTDELFTFVRRFESKEVIDADRETLSDLLVSTYRGQRRSQREAVAGLSHLTVTQSRAILVYTLRGI